MKANILLVKNYKEINEAHEQKEKMGLTDIPDEIYLDIEYHCPNCEVELEYGTAICGECETEIPPDFYNVDRFFCPNCEFELEFGMEECPECNTDIPRSLYEPDKELKPCPYCGYQVERDAVICSSWHIVGS